VIAKQDLEYLRMTARDHGYRTQWRGRLLQIQIHHLIARWRTSRPVRFISLDNLKSISEDASASFLSAAPSTRLLWRARFHYSSVTQVD
jgi:hypothetical protein